jgi:hypothetical protein
MRFARVAHADVVRVSWRAGDESPTVVRRIAELGAYFAEKSLRVLCRSNSLDRTNEPASLDRLFDAVSLSGNGISRAVSRWTLLAHRSDGGRSGMLNSLMPHSHCCFS